MTQAVSKTNAKHGYFVPFRNRAFRLLNTQAVNTATRVEKLMSIYRANLTQVFLKGALNASEDISSQPPPWRISALGGSKVQIGGPVGAFVPILGGIVASYGYEGLAIATILEGLMLLCMGPFRLGNLIKFIPYSVIAGFTSGIAFACAVPSLTTTRIHGT